MGTVASAPLTAIYRSRLVVATLSFEASDRVIDAKVFGDGSMKIRNAIQSLQRIKLEGEPPQRDGFEPEFRGARESDMFLHCPTDEPGVLRAQFSSDLGGNIYSKATGKWYR